MLYMTSKLFGAKLVLATTLFVFPLLIEVDSVGTLAPPSSLFVSRREVQHEDLQSRWLTLPPWHQTKIAPRDEGPDTDGPSTIGTTSADGIENALGPGQDPSPFSRVENGNRTYYFPTVDFKDGIYMQASTNLSEVLSVKSNEHLVHKYRRQIGTEAPGIFQWGPSAYLMYVSTVVRKDTVGNGTLFVLRNDGHDLLSNWQEHGQVAFEGGRVPKIYDAQPFVHPNGKRYLLYADALRILIAELTAFSTIAHETTVYSSPKNSYIVEAPGVALKNDMLNVYWSENYFFDPAYNVQNKAVPVTADPVKRSTWSSHSKSIVLRSNKRTSVYGPGSAATFAGPTGAPWIAYSCFYNPNGFDPKKSNPRRVQVQPMEFTSSGALKELTPRKPTRFANP